MIPNYATSCRKKRRQTRRNHSQGHNPYVSATFNPNPPTATTNLSSLAAVIPQSGFPPIQTVKQFCGMVQMSVRTVKNWIVPGGMPCLRPGPRKILIETEPALAWLRESFGVKGRVTSYRPRVRKSAGSALAAKQGASTEEESK